MSEKHIQNSQTLIPTQSITQTFMKHEVLKHSSHLNVVSVCSLISSVKCVCVCVCVLHSAINPTLLSHLKFHKIHFHTLSTSKAWHAPWEHAQKPANVDLNSKSPS